MSITRRALGAFATALPLPAFAQAWPTRSIRLLVGYAAGGPTDVVARIIAQDMTATLGQPVVVENRSGANGLVATELLVREAPDGYTLLATTLSHSVNAILLPGRYDPLQGITPIGLVATLPLIAVTSAQSPFTSMAALVEAAKQRPGEVSYGSAGNGGSAHLAGALLATRSGTQLTHVPFRGNAPALSEVMAGRVSFMFYPMVGIADLIARGQLRPLAVTTAQRLPDYPDVLSMAEAGFPGFDAYVQSLGMIAPPGLPAAITARLNAALRASLARPETSQRLKDLGALVQSSSPEGFLEFLQGDLQRWRQVIAAARITAD